MSLPPLFPREMWQLINSFIYNPDDNNPNTYLNEEAVKNAQATINLSMSCKALYNACLNEARVTALKDLKINNLKKCLYEGNQQAKDDFLINTPEELVQSFKTKGLDNNIAKLPVLDLKNRMGGTGYIDFLKPKDLSHSIMQFTDRHNRRGIAMHIRVHEETSKYKDLEGVLVCFQRSRNNNSDWQVVVNAKNGDDLDHALQDYHNSFEHTGPFLIGCSTCYPPTLNWFTKIIPRILSGTDPIFELAVPSNEKDSWLSFFNPFKYFG